MKWTLLGFLLTCVIFCVLLGLGMLIDKWPYVFLIIAVLVASYGFGWVLKKEYGDK